MTVWSPLWPRDNPTGRGIAPWGANPLYAVLYFSWFLVFHHDVLGKVRQWFAIAFCRGVLEIATLNPVDHLLVVATIVF